MPTNPPPDIAVSEAIRYLDEARQVAEVLEDKASGEWIANRCGLAAALIRSQAEELKLWKPWTQEEIDAAILETEEIPASDEEIAAIVAKVTDPAYRPTEPECVLMAAKIKQQAEQIARYEEALKEYAELTNWDCEENASEYEFANQWLHPSHGYELAQRALDTTSESRKEGWRWKLK